MAIRAASGSAGVTMANKLARDAAKQCALQTTRFGGSGGETRDSENGRNGGGLNEFHVWYPRVAVVNEKRPPWFRFRHLLRHRGLRKALQFSSLIRRAPALQRQIRETAP